MGEEEDEQSPFLERTCTAGGQSLQPLKRTGTQWTAVANIIAGVIGAGVLSLAWSVAQLGWLLGPMCIICFAGITAVSTFLLCDCYKYPDPEFGTVRNRSYMQAVKLYLGEGQQWICGVLAQECLYGTGIAYTITAAASVKAIQKSNCYHRNGHDASCEYGYTVYMQLFGLLQILMSLIPEFHNMEWLSVFAAVMSCTYSSIGFGLGLSQVIENGTIKGTMTGVVTTSITKKLWLCFEAVGDIAFAYPYSIIVLEIQDTLNTPPPENQTMKKASAKAIIVTTIFYLCCGCFGYAAFGDSTPGNLLTGFGFYEPYWLVDFANACIVLHLVVGYQIFSQPIYAGAERWFVHKFPDSSFVNDFHIVKIPLLRPLQFNLLRLCFRTTYVISTTTIAMLFPYFNSALGVLGTLNFWPLTIYFPIEMYFKQYKTPAWSRQWVLLYAFSFVSFIITALGFVGSLAELIMEKLG